MNSNEFDNPFADLSEPIRLTAPCVMVIFGATGDLTGRKLLPALYNLAKDDQLPVHFACVGFARREKSNEEFRKEMQEAVERFSRTKPLNDDLWRHFEDKLYYHRSEFDHDDGYESLKKLLEQLDNKYETKGNRLFYLSTPPSYFPLIIEKLHEHGLIYPYENSRDEPWSRVIIEKPFGHDLASAQALQNHITKFLNEDQIFRIDHYLGKETVQNLLALRFSNPIFESIWNNRYIDNVQITVAEEIGIGTRGNFFEEAGILRDIVQNHMMQLVSLVGMDPPVNLQAQAIRDEKVKVLESIRAIAPTEMDKYTVRGQYGSGFINGTAVCGYRQESKVSPTSNVETFAALELYINNWRWSGVPFYLRAGKRLPKRATEIAIVFKPVPAGCLFQIGDNQIESNILVVRIQPDEGISFKMNCKVPGLFSAIQPVKMDFRYGSTFGLTPPEAYERLLCDCMTGDNTLFARADEVMASWKLLTPVLNHWANTKADFPNYKAGTWGPAASDQMLARTGRSWRLP